MDKNLLLALRILKRNKLLHLFLCIEVALALFLINLLFNRITYSYKLVDIANNAHVKTSVLFMGRGFDFSTDTNLFTFDPTLQKICADLGGNPYYMGVSSVQQFAVISDGQTIEATSFDEVTASKFKTVLKSGRWYTDAAVKDGRIPCVIVDTSTFANHYKVGDTITGSSLSYNRYTGEQLKSNTSVTFEVTGIISRDNAYILRPDTAVTNTAQPLRNIIPSMYPDTIELLCGELNPSFLQTFEPEKGILYFDESMGEKDLNELMTELRKSGYVVKLSDMTDATLSDLTDKLKTDLPMFLSFLSISMIGLISIALLNSKKQIKTFSIYYLCGCRWRKSILIYFLYFGILLAVSVVLFLILMVVSYNSDYRGIFYLYEITGKGLLVTAGISLAFLAASTAIPFFHVKKHSLVSIYRER